MMEAFAQQWDSYCNEILDFNACLCEISAIVESNNVENVFVLADLNAHPEITITIVADNSLHGKPVNQNYRKPKFGDKPFGTEVTTTFNSQTAPQPSLREYDNVTSSMTYIDARRANSFSNPANLQDPKFQELLNKYRGMVQKNNAPQINQQLPPVPNPQQSQHYPNMQYGQTAIVHYQYTRNGQNGAQIPEYYGLPERYERKKDRIDNIYKPWQSPLTLPARYTTPGREQLPRYSSLPGLIKGYHPQWGRAIERQKTTRPPPTGRVYVAVTHPATEATIATTIARDTNDTGSTIVAKDAAAEAAARYTPGAKTTTKRRRRTTPPRVSFDEDCDYVAYYCLKAYDTGEICGRTLYNLYSTFQNYCMLDYVNCMERYEVWQIVHMGECFELKILSEYLHYPYQDDYFLDQYYIIEDM